MFKKLTPFLCAITVFCFVMPSHGEMKGGEPLYRGFHSYEKTGLAIAGEVSSFTHDCPVYVYRAGKKIKIDFSGYVIKENDLIETEGDCGGRLHIVFKDSSSIHAGPKAELSIDKFVYDPKIKSSEIIYNMGKGAFRFVGGKISKEVGIVIKTPSAAIVIRGTDFEVLAADVSKNETQDIIKVKSGSTYATAKATGRTVIIRAGQMAKITIDSGRIIGPKPIK